MKMHKSLICVLVMAISATVSYSAESMYNTNAPGLPQYWGLRVKQYRTTATGDVNAGVPRSTTTFWPIVDTNGVTVTYAVDTQQIKTNLNAGAAGGWNANEISIPSGLSTNIVFNVTSSVKIRSMTVQLEWRCPSVCFTGGGTMLATLKHDSTGPVIVFQSSTAATPTLYAAAPNYQYAKITFDPAALATTDLLFSANPGLYNTQNFVAGVNYQPNGGVGAFSSFTNAVSSGTWTLNVLNSTVYPMYFIGCQIDITGDSTSFSTRNTYFKDLNPRSVTEAHPYTYVNGRKSYAVPRYLADD
jgi:hypothetical protein